MRRIFLISEDKKLHRLISSILSNASVEQCTLTQVDSFAEAKDWFEIDPQDIYLINAPDQEYFLIGDI